jgi:hypothetical protein
MTVSYPPIGRGDGASASSSDRASNEEDQDVGKREERQQPLALRRARKENRSEGQRQDDERARCEHFEELRAGQRRCVSEGRRFADDRCADAGSTAPSCATTARVLAACMSASRTPGTRWSARIAAAIDAGDEPPSISSVVRVK